MVGEKEYEGWWTIAYNINPSSLWTNFLSRGSPSAESQTYPRIRRHPDTFLGSWSLLSSDTLVKATSLPIGSDMSSQQAVLRNARVGCSPKNAVQEASLPCISCSLYPARRSCLLFPAWSLVDRDGTSRGARDNAIDQELTKLGNRTKAGPLMVQLKIYLMVKQDSYDWSRGHKPTPT